MMSDLIRMQQLLQGGTLSDAEVASLRECVDGICRDARLSVQRIGRSFALMCETFATVDPEQLPPELWAEIEAIVLGRDLPEPDTSGPVTPMDLLQIETRLAAMGDRADAARLRRLADDLVSKPDEPRVFIGWDHSARDCMATVSIATRRADGAFFVTTVETMVAACMPGSSAADRQSIADRVSKYFIGLAEGGTHD